MPDPVFPHGVASGDPEQARVMLWTRVSGATGAVPVTWWVRDGSGAVVAEGTATAHPDADHTVHVDVAGLVAGTRYAYGFAALDAESPTGRTRTLPADDVATIRLAQVSCAKFNAGFFNAYARIAERDDVDLVLHLGDYIYEASQTPPASQTPGADIGRPFDPPHECKTLADYRRRYAQYHADPDVAAAHAAHPFVSTLDDHELADGAWREGAAEHVPERDGPWATRRAAAFQAREEWLPIRRPDPADPERAYRQLRLGRLAEVILLDTRSRRDEPVPAPAMNAPTRTALGADQREWLWSALERARSRWCLLANPSVMARTWDDTLGEDVRTALAKVKLIETDLLGPDWDQWDGYPAERQALLDRIAARPVRDVVVLSGDVHVGMANELHASGTTDGEPVAVEIVNPSLTAQNLDDKLGWAPRTQSLPLAEAISAGMPHVRWLDLDSHGYVHLTVTEDQLTARWYAVDGVLARSSGVEQVAEWSVRHGVPRLIATRDGQPLAAVG